MARKKVPEDRWTSLKAAISRKWTDLTDEDLTAIKDDLDILAERLQKRYGISLEDAIESANQFLYDFREASLGADRRARTAASQAAGTLDEVAHEYAWTAVAGAFLLGGLIGYICGREDRRRSYWF